MTQHKSATDKRKEINRQRQEEILKSRQNATEYKTSWDKVINNVAIKENDYPGGKDVSRFRQSLLNKKLDDSGSDQTNQIQF